MRNRLTGCLRLELQVPMHPRAKFYALGGQSQCDWAHFGRFAVGKALRPLMAFVMVLSYSR